MTTLTPRQIKNRLKKQQAEIEAQRNQKPVKSLTINIEWRRSYTWGYNPHAEAVVVFQDGTFERRNGYKCSGCGYDKESTVIAEIFNDFLRYKLYQSLKFEPKWSYDEKNSPYGVYYFDGKTQPYPDVYDGYVRKPTYNGGVGTSCYYEIGKFIGGEFEKLASGKSFDVFKYTDGEK